VVVRGLVGVAPAQAFQRPAIAFPDRQQRVVEGGESHLVAGLDVSDWRTSHQALAPSMSLNTRSMKSGSTWVYSSARGPSSSRISRSCRARIQAE
jgi:hypothetical protein